MEGFDGVGGVDEVSCCWSLDNCDDVDGRWYGTESYVRRLEGDMQQYKARDDGTTGATKTVLHSVLEQTMLKDACEDV